MGVDRADLKAFGAAVQGKNAQDSHSGRVIADRCFFHTTMAVFVARGASVGVESGQCAAKTAVSWILAASVRCGTLVKVFS